MKRSNLITLCALVGLAGCGSSGGGGYKPSPVKETPLTTINPGEEKSLFPVAVGNMWTYEAQASAVVDNKPSQKKRQLTIEIKAVTPQGTGQLVTMELREDDVVFSNQNWLVDDTGVYQVDVSAQGVVSKFTPPQCILKFPVNKDDEWTYTGLAPTSLGANTKVTAKSKNMGPQLVDTFAGQVSAYSVETTSDLKNSIVQNGKTVPLEGKMSSQVFFAPKVGMVRLVQTVQGRAGGETTTHTLMQSTVK